MQFKDFITLQRGFDLPIKEIVNGSYPVVGSTSIIGYHNQYKILAPGVTTGRSGSLGIIQFIRENYWPHNTSLWVRDFKGNLPKYVYYFLQTLDLRQFNSGAGVPTLNRNHLDNLAIEIHHPSDQRKIAAILSAYDDLIENNTRRIKILEDMAQAVYREWFVHFRFPGHEGVRMVESEMGLIPEGWEVVKIEDVYETGSGGTPSRKIEQYYGGSINWVKTKELNDSYIFETEEKITEMGFKNSSTKLYQENTVLIAMYGATIGMLGILGSPATTNQACCAILQKDEPFSPMYIFLNLLENRSNLLNLRQGAAQQNVNQIIIKSFKIFKPSKSIMIEFNQKISVFFEQMKNLQQKNTNLRITRDLLLPKLISGELDVSELNITIPEAMT